MFENSVIFSPFIWGDHKWLEFAWRIHKYCDKQGNIKTILMTCVCLSPISWYLVICCVIISKTALQEKRGRN